MAMSRELPNSSHVSASMVQKSEGSLSDVPPTKGKVDLGNFPPEVKGRVMDQLIVFNPLTQKYQMLPPFLHPRTAFLIHMYVDQSSKSYYVLAAGSSASGEESLSRITELYDSRTGHWQRVGDLPGPAFALNEYQSGVFHNGNILCIGFLELGDQTVKGILGYNVKKRLWSTKWTAAALPNSTFRVLIGIPRRSSLDHSRSDSVGFTDLHDTRRARMSSASSSENLPSNPGRSFWCFILGIVGILTRLNVVAASPESAPGPSSSQASSTFPTVWYWGVRATIVAAVVGVLGLCVAIYMCLYRRERGDSLRGVLREFFRPFGQGAGGLRMYARGVKLRGGSVDVVRLRSSRGSSRGSSPESSRGSSRESSPA